jgi:hypothetical protein
MLLRLFIASYLDKVSAWLKGDAYSDVRMPVGDLQSLVTTAKFAIDAVKQADVTANASPLEVPSVKNSVEVLAEKVELARAIYDLF